MRVRGLVGLAILLSYATLAAGDGGYFPLHATQKLPEIPMQQAVISFKDGVERLLIDSTLKGEGTDFAWIVPVPSEPTAVVKASPAITTILSEQKWVGITHFWLHEYLPALVHIGFLCFIWGPIAFRKKGLSFGAAFLITLVYAVVMLVVDPIAGGHSSSTAAVPGVDVKHASTVGSYDVSVLAADSAQSLNQWLTANGYAELPKEDGVKIADEYAREHWRFVAAKLRREGDGLSRPHPLMITFPATAPVYPMRLTRIADSRLYLELYVIADGTASVTGMTCDFSDIFAPPSWKADFSHGEDFKILCSRSDLPSQPPIIFAMPSLTDLMWSGCTLTKLSATVAPEQMKKDFCVTVGSPGFVQRHLYSYEGASSVAILAGFLFFVAFILARALAWRGFQRDPEEEEKPGSVWEDVLSSLLFNALIVFILPLLFTSAIIVWSKRLPFAFAVPFLCFAAFLQYSRWELRRRVLRPILVLLLLPSVLVLASIGLGTAVYLCLPKTEVQVSRFSYDWEVSIAADKLKEDAAVFLAGKSEAEIARIVDGKYPELKRHYDISTDDRGIGIFVRVYQSEPAKAGRLMYEIRIPQAPQTAKTPTPPAGEGENPR